MTAENILKQIDLFSELDDSEAERLLPLLREKRVSKDTIIFHQEDEGGGLFLILEGEIKISRIVRDGREVIIAVLQKGNFFGEMSLLDGQPRAATATAASSSRMLVMDRETFLHQVLPRSDHATTMLRELSKRIRAADKKIEQLAIGNVFERLFHFLGHLARRFPIRSGRAVITRRPTHQELAEIVGASRETVTRTLAAMEKNKLIEIHQRQIVILPAFFEEEKRLSFG